jgi:uncharacterized membrane protein (UPF0127 family)
MGSRVAALAALLMVAATVAARAACSDDTLWVRGDFGEVRFSVSLAQTPQERAQGLMFVEDMPRFTGMLFIWDRPAPRSFWMRNTLIPLDILFADARGVVVSIAADAQPLDETSLLSGAPAQFVLEINGGMAAELGIEPGAEFRHPRIGADAAWPCD